MAQYFLPYPITLELHFLWGYFIDDKTPSFLAFSIYTNGQKVLSYKKSKSTDTMHCLNGIRVISTQWVVIGHS